MSSVATRKSITVIDGGKGGAGSGSGGGGDGGRPADGWRSGLSRNRDKNVEGTLHNLILILENDPRLAGLWWLNESSNQIELTRDAAWQGGSRTEFVDADSYELASWLQNPATYGMKCSDEAVLKAVIAVARRCRRHPIREYLTGLKWDGVPRVEGMLVQLFGAPDNSYSRRASMCFAVGAVARILWFDPKQPAVGAQVDFMLVLEGEQGKRKSSADVTAVKTAISRRVDKFRAPYERVPRAYRRECVFAGTTNEHEYLRDPTGGRRFLPVRTDGVVDLDGIVEQRDQLWAEAAHLFGQGFQWWDLPEDAADEQEARYIGDSWEERIMTWLSGRMPGDKAYPSGRLDVGWGIPATWATTDELLLYAIGADASKHGKPEQMRVAAAMKRLKWAQRRVEVDGYRHRRWYPTAGAVKPQAAARPSNAMGGDDEPPF